MRLLLLIILHSSILTKTIPASGQDSALFFHLKVNQDIDPRTSRYLELGMGEARQKKADYIILELNTYGGTLKDGDNMRQMILDSKIPFVAFINKNAASAGALIAIACDKIYMANGASMGAATVVTQDGSSAPDKYQSYMRSIMRSTAEANGRNPKIAEAMVDQDIVVDSVSQAGKVLTLSPGEAIALSYCDGETNSISDILDTLSITNHEVIPFELSSTESLIAFFLNPVLSGILVLIILGGIYFELQTPGVGFPIIASIIATLLYFIPNYLNGLAENWEILLFVVGIILILLELFIIPGFGFFGILGIISTLLALGLVSLNNDFFDFSFVNTSKVMTSLLTLIIGLMILSVVLFFSGIRLTNSSFFKKISLKETLDSSKGFTSKPTKKNMVGKEGITHTDLRPSGKIKIDNQILDAFTSDNFIPKNTQVYVISEEGTSLKVLTKD